MAKSKDQEFELSKFSDEELQAELERRAKDGDPLPKPLEKPDFKRLAKLVVEGVEEAHEEKYEDDDFEHFVYEAAMEAVYGKGFWAWRNKQNWDG